MQCTEETTKLLIWAGELQDRLDLVRWSAAMGLLQDLRHLEAQVQPALRTVIPLAHAQLAENLVELGITGANLMSELAARLTAPEAETIVYNLGSSGFPLFYNDTNVDLAIRVVPGGKDSMAHLQLRIELTTDPNLSEKLLQRAKEIVTEIAADLGRVLDEAVPCTFEHLTLSDD